MSYVYFARVGQYVKIGFSYRPAMRMQSLLKSPKLRMPADLDKSLEVQLISTIADCIVQDERRLHAYFADHRVEGEWFHADPVLAALPTLNYSTVRADRAIARRQRAEAKKLATSPT